MKTIHWIILTASVMLLSACSTVCREREEGKIKFTEAQRQLIPYKKNAVVNFIDNSGKTVDFKVAESKKNWQYWYIYNEDPCTDYLLAEQKYTLLVPISGGSKITFRMLLNYSDSDPETHNIDGVLRWDGSCRTTIEMDLDYGGKQYVCFLLWANQEGVISTNNLHESIEINNHVYHDVVEMKTTIKVYDSQLPVQLFYNKDYGILQIKVNNANYLMLNR